MPAPIAHCSLVLLLRPLDKRGLLPELMRTHRWPLLLVMLFSCVMPDMDFGIRVFAPGTALGTHGYAMHSLFMMGLMSLLLAGLWWLVFRKGFALVLLFALLGSYSHILMDMMTYRATGAGLLWPFVDQRVRLPFSVFYGVRHSGTGNWGTHLITVSTETLFFMGVWLLTSLLSRTKKAPAPAEAEVDPA